MKHLLIFAAVFGLGYGAAGLAHLAGQPAQAASMNMSVTGSADGQMQAAMDRMNLSMKAMKMTGQTDRDFMAMMIPHHRSAIDMAKIELKSGQRAELKALARSIISSQGKEISQMHSWLRSWYGM